MNDFFWGLASSAFQTEGFIKNDMTEWEAKGFFRKDGKNPRYQNGSAHWKHWHQDFELLKEIGVNAYRFSVEWARIEQKYNQFDEAALDQYERMVDKLLELQIEPFLTLHHFSHPVWFHERTPWTSVTSRDVFCRYLNILYKRLGDRIRYWITFNEPLVWVLAAYGDAKFPPGKQSFDEMIKALINILHAHTCAYQIIKTYQPKAQIGIAKHFIEFAPHRSWFMADHSLSELVHNFFNEMIPDAFVNNRLKFHFPLLFRIDEPIPLQNAIDFWGVNYYYRMFTAFRLNLKRPIRFVYQNDSKNGLSDMGWEIYPQGLTKALKFFAKYRKNIFVTENGIATNDEQQRIRFVNDHIQEVLAARNAGLPVNGYFYWSFLDNYEWLEGKSKRFGLVHVDYERGFIRKIKRSGKHYSRIIKIYREGLGLNF